MAKWAEAQFLCEADVVRTNADQGKGRGKSDHEWDAIVKTARKHAKDNPFPNLHMTADEYHIMKPKPMQWYKWPYVFEYNMVEDWDGLGGL